MMRRLLAALAAIALFAAPAFAQYTKDVALVMPDLTYFSNFARDANWQRAMVEAALARWGVTYDEYTAPPTNWCRTGVFGTSPAMSGTQTARYRAVIHLMFDRTHSTYGGGLTYDPRDMFQTGAIPGRGDSLPTVPQLIIAINSPLPTIDNNVADTTGVAASWSSGSRVFGFMSSPERDYGVTAYLPNKDIVWHQKYAHMPVILNSGSWKGQAPPVKFRALVGLAMSASADTLCHADCDSVMAGRVAQPDTFGTWLLDYSAFNNGTGGKACIVMTLGGVSTTALNPELIGYGIAAVDSQALRFTGGRITHRAQPVAFHIDDGWRRINDYSLTGGLFENDSTAWKHSLDSLAALPGMKYALGMGIAYAHNYQFKDSLWLVTRGGSAWRVTPHVHTGLVAVTNEPLEKSFLGADATRAPGMVDLFRVARSYAAFRSGCVGCGADTSFQALQTAAFNELSKRFPGKIDRLAMPPTDDWTPKGMDRYNMGPGLDSLALLLRAAGYVGVRTNLSCQSCVGDLQTLNGAVANAGFTSSPMQLELRDPTSGYVTSRFGIVPTVGYSNTGSGTWKAGVDNFNTNVFGYFVGNTGAAPSVAIPSNLSGSSINPYFAANLFAAHVSDFGCDPSSIKNGTDDRWFTVANLRAKRPGWWTFKWTEMWARGLAVVDTDLAPVVWPEDLAKKASTW